MATTASTRTPTHLWIVGAVALLYSCFGAYDYIMSHMRNLKYIASSMPGVDPNVALNWMDGFPIYAKIGWALGVWGGLLGAILLLMRSRYAVHAFLVSMIGIVLSIGYQLALAPALQGADGMAMKLMPWIIMIIGAALLAYSHTMTKQDVLR
jgi:hypothetical protein